MESQAGNVRYRPVLPADASNNTACNLHAPTLLPKHSKPAPQ